MEKEHISPSKDKSIRNIDEERGRGQRNNNIFLDDSVKTEQDWVLHGDRHLVHWIYYLETDTEVKTFDFTSAYERDSDRFWVVDVIRSNGTRINHQIGRGAGEGGEATQLQKDPSSDNASRLENRV